MAQTITFACLRSNIVRRCFSNNMTNAVLANLTGRRCLATNPSENLNNDKKLPEISSQLLSHLTGQPNEPKELIKPVVEWIPVYRFPYIQLAAVLCRFKVYQTFGLGLACPVCLGFYANGLMTVNQVGVILGISTFACITMYVFGSLFRRLVGFVYIHQDERQVKIAHLTFWGRRQDEIFDLADVYPLSTSNRRLTEPFLTIMTESSKDKYFITLRFGGIVDKEKFNQVFGEISVLNK